MESIGAERFETTARSKFLRMLSVTSACEDTVVGGNLDTGDTAICWSRSAGVHHLAAMFGELLDGEDRGLCRERSPMSLGNFGDIA